LFDSWLDDYVLFAFVSNPIRQSASRQTQKRLQYHPVYGRFIWFWGGGSVAYALAGFDLTLPESRRAVGLKSLCGARHCRGSYGVRLAGCGVTDRVRRTPQDQFCMESLVQRLRMGQTVVKVCCWHQELSESALVLFCSFWSS
jgi:hypothetical protein